MSGRATWLRNIIENTRVDIVLSQVAVGSVRQSLPRCTHRRIGKAKNLGPFSVGGATGSTSTPSTTLGVPTPSPQSLVVNSSPPRVPSPPRHHAAVGGHRQPSPIVLETRRCDRITVIMDGPRGNLIRMAPRQEVKAIVTQALQGESWKEALENNLEQMHRPVQWHQRPYQWVC